MKSRASLLDILVQVSIVVGSCWTIHTSIETIIFVQYFDQVCWSSSGTEIARR